MAIDFVIIGAQKGGSTFLHKCLAEHPGVGIPSGEVALFEQPNASVADLKGLLYREVGDRARYDVVGIKRPNLMCNPEFPDRVLDVAPDVKLVAVIRDPIDRLISAYYHYVRNGFLPVEHIESGLPKIISGEYRKSFWRAFEVLEFSHYCKYLRRLVARVPASNIHVGHFSGLVGQPSEFLGSVMAFIGVPFVRVDHQKVAASKPQSVVYSIERLKVLTVENYLRGEVDGLGCVRKGARRYVFDESDKNTIREVRKFDREVLVHKFGNEKPKLSEHLRAELEEIFDEDIAFSRKIEGGMDWRSVLPDERGQLAP